MQIRNDLYGLPLSGRMVPVETRRWRCRSQRCWTRWVSTTVVSRNLSL